ncbi:serine phosphatase RsbU (regulator of sigma subunit) [Desulfobotulus alkaliphilus]|uniref:Serine phosphatase RsbU (Regulator of sigma subunit) n=1 Tax=Desulfobotulus alkaliphilus TaxID=622671 RepID=A0A562S7I6_9BACT|nr:SpoIIE family protein phosphatase [Desulfobotulus alkaliphilus]TWI77389.1 serine phosphatase RsbU (regulator of sigma subunit) [Desulfobotulus alkaliphilus]
MVRPFSISLRIPLCFLAIALLMTLASTIFMVVQDRRQAMRYMEKTLNQIDETYTQALAALIWNMGFDEIRLITDGIHNIPGVMHVIIKDDKESILAEKGKESATGLHRSYTLYQLEGLVSSSIGSLGVTMDLDALNQNIRFTALRILAARSIDLMLMGLVFLWIIHHLVTRHLKTMASYTQQMNLDRLETPLRLHGRKPDHPTDELDIVAQAINAMRISIAESLEQKAEKARMEGELRAAANIQKVLLPTRPPAIKFLDLAFSFEPALEVSGDYFDFFPLDEHRLGIVVADASGKGIPAALIANAARVLLMANPRQQDAPEALFRTLNQTLPEAMGMGHFLTMSYLLLDTKRQEVSLVSAGHDPVYMKKASGEILPLKPPGYPFCRLHQKTFDLRLKSLTLSFEPGDTLFAYTDGLSESLSPEQEPFGEQGIQKILAEPHSRAAYLIQHMKKKLSDFCQHIKPSDDVTLVAVCFCKAPNEEKANA